MGESEGLSTKGLATTLLLDPLSLANLDRWGLGGGILCHPVLDLGGHGNESLLDVGGLLRAGLQKRNALLLCKLLGSGKIDDLLCGQVTLVSNKHLVDFVGSVAINLVHPLLDIVERLLIRHVVNNNDAVCPAVVAGSDGTEALLASSVPNLELDRLAIELKSTNLEVNTDGGDVALRVGIVREPEQQTTLADTRVADEEEFEKIIAAVTITIWRRLGHLLFSVHSWCQGECLLD
eukprot:CAMPEP_0175952210 /NCGR_PEP_ID=MMETSP0108-20121206/30620_1 /TAXON_ID=195067 ORGANISM="Goniomonas pacifica, Strain CCMP1869" /NCGR_SAMPLE_ID=MMETSP0108 /ASSEMBLY_ACC=CAM_ASM_000204 /LENGTH=234 /DNA_ID=CAMNT_0017278537 /DNA_START=113 /DNA_END=818 /DNA_ORIENTATION=-